MVGVSTAATLIAVVVCCCRLSVAAHAVSLDYRDVCISLSTAISCVNRSLDAMPSNLPNWTKTLSLNNNHIGQVDKSILQDLTRLEELKMNKNRVRVIYKENFGKLTNLKVLELNRNQLENITALSFQYLEHVTVLRLRRNKIRNLPDGSFFGLSRIKQLQLDYNFIESIKKSWLYNLESLTSLSLSNNRISAIDSDAWEFCKGLIELDLSSNALKYIRRDSFRDLSLLQVLNLQNNLITNIEESAFSHTPNLYVLNLNVNKISWSIEDPNGVYRGLSNLRNFSIASNEIKSINKHAFSGLTQLKYLDMNNNNIGGIQLNAFKDLQQLEVLILNTSALLCDCNLQWFSDFLHTRPLNVTTVCAYPEWLRGRSLLNVPSNNFTCDNLTKPRIIEEPDAEIMALKEESITLTCRAVSSSPSPMVFKWKKDNVELRHPGNNMTVRATTDGNNTESISQLTISRVQHADAGKYQCVVSNSFGTSYTRKSSIAVLIYPTFEKIPSNITVQAGATAKLVCSAAGEPQPEIAWQKDGGNDFPAARERRMQVMSGDDMFFIISAKLSDMGVYSCTAHNAAGSIVANATLIVEERPSFSKPMENKTVKMGESVVIQCMASGSPKPTIQWYKDNIPITPTERHFFTAEEQLMIIVDSVFSDAGNYTCKLNNTLGVEVGHSTIIVKPGNMPFSDMMGIIIITVVSCAVLTSFIWVVIIYQTRKGMSGSSVRNLNSTVMLDFSEKRYPDNASEHSSCKDSGTGDSAKRSNDDLMPPDEYTLIINETNPENKNNSSMRAASMVYLAAGEVSGVSTPLLHGSPHAHGMPVQVKVRSTNHDRQAIEVESPSPPPPPPPLSCSEEDE
ncbi:leucine-rich repeats and immunoglobulin-like domains protein 3 isoform X1 [Atheta coriaria]|uniref:leucine-rich repeats and immunoglobulin-like domains protein 3 isoform X1 n=1 Tax=Dalotia coriaria TaxID=877792 RepID=UPI0031F3D71E